ncbi:hypothetical protein PoB_002494900 [Plakobranchus ocellatus]|uniref:Uncharacterized protein n=1 Tax=Plakobranchus ocellatus TaxID=259542 RepID=A0AAV3ZSX3_9GAST|nr:hypothetical protein PoB_002494900 [Plakobranchus ocellatus]
MTSQKRFRHQENSNSGSRTRDLPPRFKRQKSSSGQIPLAPRAISPPASQLEKNSVSDKMTKESQVHSSTVSLQKGRPCDYIYSDIPNTSISQQVFYPMPLNQMWSTNAYTGFHPTMLAPLSTQVGQPYLSDPTSYINESCAPSPSNYQCSPISPWSTSGYGSPYQSSCSSPAPTVSSPTPPNVMAEQVKSSQSTKQTSAHKSKYIDSDLRTIEMLRELERVADKESQEAEETSSDRKPPMSHHLRMLVCAMDRYTESIEDEVASSTRNDDSISTHGSSKSSPSISPVPVKPFLQENVLKSKIEEPQNHFWSQDQRSQSMALRGRPVLGMSSASAPVQQLQPQSPVNLAFSTSGPISQTPWFQNGQPKQHLTEWNLWSGPSFDFPGVLAYSPNVNGSNVSFDTFQDACFPPNKERKPLYKR